jgi:transposase
LDIHRETVVATALSPEGERINQVTLGSSREELTRYLADLPGEEKRVVLEACAMWEAYFDSVESTGATAILSNPLKTRMIAEATIKTDRVDSATLATLLRLDAIPTAYAPPEPVRKLRHLVRDRLFYRRKMGMLMNHTYGQMIYRGIVYESGSLRTVKGRQKARELDLESVNRALDTVEYLLDKSKELDRRIHETFLESKEAQLLRTIPGIGELAAVTLVAFLCPVSRFGSVEKISSYAGLVPTTHQSGDSCYHGRLKRDCNRLLQSLLIETSWAHRRYAPRGDAAKVGKRVGRRRGANKGACAAAHKLLKIVYAVLKRGTPYTPHAPERPAAKSFLRDPRAAARQCVRGIALGPVAADRLLAH